VNEARQLVALLNDERGPATAGDLREALRQTALSETTRGAAPEELWDAARSSGRRIELQWTRHDVDGGLDAWVRDKDDRSDVPEGAGWPVALCPDVETRPYHAYANHPLREKTMRKLIPALRLHLQKKLPAYMVPSVFESLDRVPLNPNGKVDRHALPPPLQIRPDLETAYTAPSNALEAYLTEVWEEALGLVKVGIQDDFFALGGESMKAAVLTAQLSDKLGEVVFPTVLFDAPTIEKLAQYLRRLFPASVERCFGLKAEASDGVRSTVIDLARTAKFRECIPAVGPRTVPSPEGKNPRAIFVLCAPRCGSTLLRVMLAGHSKLFAPPEQELLNFNTLGERAKVLSGKDAVWREGTLRALVDLRKCSADDARALMVELEARDLPVKAFYREMQNWLGGRTLVDKTASYALDMQTLRRAEEDFDEPVYIHLVRHPAAMVHSFVKTQLQQVWFRWRHNYMVHELAELVWLVSQQNIKDFLHKIPSDRYCRIAFEDLVKNPRHSMETICRKTGLPFEEGMLQPYSEQDRKMTDGLHRDSMMLGDMKFGKYRSIEAQVADDWKKETDDTALGHITREVAAHFGYTMQSSLDRSCLVPIKRSGSRNPLFVVHPGGGSLLAYGTLVRHVNDDRPVYGLQARGLGDGLEPHTRIAEMATYYIKDIRKAQPHGPYLIGGRCLGGFIAFEMAQQLIAAGEEVAFLGLWDPRHAPLLAPGERPVNADETGERDARATRGSKVKPFRFLRRFRKLGIRIAAWWKYQRLTPEEQRLKDFVRNHRQARKEYTARVYPGRIWLWRTADLGSDSRHEQRWRNLAAQGLEVFVIPAEHFGMFREPHVKVLAEQLNACLAHLE
jgi:thioesterase domain-containing protein